MKYDYINKGLCYFITLSRAANAITTFYDESLQELGISTKQYSLLRNLSRLGESSTVELANFVNLERSTVTRNLKALLSNGWVCDLAAKGSRSHRYIVTEAGEKKLDETVILWQKAQDDIQEMLGKERMASLMETLYLVQDLQKK